jgi:molybdopterin molybdotransferase
MADLTGIAEARLLVGERTAPLPAEPVALEEALGRVLAREVVASEAVPGFDSSAMDGYAVRATDVAGAGAGDSALLLLVGESRAGRPAQASVAAGEAIAISTGAMVPEGADAVVRVEDTERADGRVEVRSAVPEGANIRRSGEDVEAGARILEPGQRIGPAELGVISSAPLPRVECARAPRVAVLLTGDELIGPAEPMRPGAVRNSNAHTVPALAREAGAVVAGVGHAGDDRVATREALERALDADLAVVTGGVSVGEHDHVRPCLAELDAEQVFWGVALRPGKPTWFGIAPGGGLIFGLPGNPVSAMVTFILFVRPALLAMQGLDPEAPRASAALETDYPKKPGRAHAVRCRLRAGEDGLLAHPTGAQGSHVLTSMLGADALALIPEASEGVAAGDRVEVELLPGSRIGGWR